MNPGIDKAIRSRWLAGLTHVALWILAYLIISGLQNTTPPFRVADGSERPPAEYIPVEKIESVFNTSWPALRTPTNQPNPFFTTHFTPAPAPPPPAPTTRKIQLCYLGFYAADGSKKQTILKMGDQFLISQVGSLVTGNIYAADASATNAMLTNSVGQTNFLTLNQPKELEVPIK